MGITRDSRHKRSATGARRAYYRKKRAFELGRQAANTRIGAKRIHTVRVRGGNLKHRALRLDSGNFAWGSEHITAKTRVLGVVYNASNNELVRTNTLVKGCIVQVDATPFRQAYEKHYGQPVTTKRRAAGQGAAEANVDEPSCPTALPASWRTAERRASSTALLSSSSAPVVCTPPSPRVPVRAVAATATSSRARSSSSTFVA